MGVFEGVHPHKLMPRTLCATGDGDDDGGGDDGGSDGDGAWEHVMEDFCPKNPWAPFGKGDTALCFFLNRGWSAYHISTNAGADGKYTLTHGRHRRREQLDVAKYDKTGLDRDSWCLAVQRCASAVRSLYTEGEWLTAATFEEGGATGHAMVRRNGTWKAATTGVGANRVYDENNVELVRANYYVPTDDATDDTNHPREHSWVGVARKYDDAEVGRRCITSAVALDSGDADVRRRFPRALVMKKHGTSHIPYAVCSIITFTKPDLPPEDRGGEWLVVEKKSRRSLANVAQANADRGFVKWDAALSKSWPAEKAPLGFVSKPRQRSLPVPKSFIMIMCDPRHDLAGGWYVVTTTSTVSKANAEVFVRYIDPIARQSNVVVLELQKYGRLGDGFQDGTWCVVRPRTADDAFEGEASDFEEEEPAEEEPDVPLPDDAFTMTPPIRGLLPLEARADGTRAEAVAFARRYTTSLAVRGSLTTYRAHGDFFLDALESILPDNVARDQLLDQFLNHVPLLGEGGDDAEPPTFGEGLWEPPPEDARRQHDSLVRSFLMATVKVSVRSAFQINGRAFDDVRMWMYGRVVAVTWSPERGVTLYVLVGRDRFADWAYEDDEYVEKEDEAPTGQYAMSAYTYDELACTSGNDEFSFVDANDNSTRGFVIKEGIQPDVRAGKRGHTQAPGSYWSDAVAVPVAMLNKPAGQPVLARIWWSPCFFVEATVDVGAQKATFDLGKTYFKTLNTPGNDMNPPRTYGVHNLWRMQFTVLQPAYLAAHPWLQVSDKRELHNHIQIWKNCQRPKWLPKRIPTLDVGAVSKSRLMAFAHAGVFASVVFQRRTLLKREEAGSVGNTKISETFHTTSDDHAQNYMGAGGVCLLAAVRRLRATMWCNRSVVPKETDLVDEVRDIGSNRLTKRQGGLRPPLQPPDSCGGLCSWAKPIFAEDPWARKSTSSGRGK